MTQMTEIGRPVVSACERNGIIARCGPFRSKVSSGIGVICGFRHLPKPSDLRTSVPPHVRTLFRPVLTHHVTRRPMCDLTEVALV